MTYTKSLGKYNKNQYFISEIILQKYKNRNASIRAREDETLAHEGETRQARPCTKNSKNSPTTP